MNTRWLLVHVFKTVETLMLSYPFKVQTIFKVEECIL